MLKTKPVYAARDFEPDDIFLIALRPQEQATWEGQDLFDVGQSKEGHPARTLLADGEVLACYGILSPWPSMGILWLWTNIVAYDHRFALWRNLKQDFFTLLLTNPALRRVEALTLQGDSAAKRVVHHLGFVFECTKQWYGPHAEDYKAWVWLRKESHKAGGTVSCLTL